MHTKTSPVRRNHLANVLIEASPVAIVLSTPNGTIEVVNRVAQTCFGYRESELAGASLDLLFPDRESRRIGTEQVHFLSHLRHPDPATEWCLAGRRSDGSNFPAKVSLYPLATTDGDKRLVNVVCLSENDACSEKHVQCERLAAILQMASGLSHESRNALQRAESCLDLLELDLTDRTELLGLTDRIRDSLHHIHKTYEEVRDYAAPISLHRVDTNLPRFLQAVVDAWTADRSCVVPEIRIRCDRQCEWGVLDEKSVGQLLNHLLDNAAAASPPDQAIELRCRRIVTTESGGIELSVRDYGSGFDEQLERCLFEPFFTTKQHGTGLGLAVCRRIVDAHDGTITLANHPAGGAVVHVALPQSRSR
ncbi:sensor histidine kinase [Aporhodopirellula aestuarii]|uniref:histidine kinase n=1 Tax=Aporhodopirellula aestuarii TaxID=2950107 RepID=A0ABT0TYN2_9BACT|nr:ATP-binding protein [Aporhodopirellula aestuarii]MCM2369708.1 ATP-binding protein [Aporhodopirellula aestuarii]